MTFCAKPSAGRFTDYKILQLLTPAPTRRGWATISREGKGEAVATPSPLSQWGRFPIFTGVTVSVTGRPPNDCPGRGVMDHALAVPGRQNCSRLKRPSL